MAGEGPRGGRGLLKPLGRVGAAAAGAGGEGTGDGHLGGPGRRSDAERLQISEFSITLLTSIKVANWKYLEPGKW